MNINTTEKDEEYLKEPRIVRALLADPSLAWIWLIPRFYLAYVWIDASFRKLGDNSWMETGLGLKSLWVHATSIPTEGTSGFGANWYSTLIQFLLGGGHYVWFAKLIAIGELLVGVMLLLGVFTGIAALGGAIMNWTFVLMGAVNANPLIFLIGLLIVLGWRTAGYWGIDRWLLPALGTPWHPGKLFRISVKLTEETLHYQCSKEHPESS